MKDSRIKIPMIIAYIMWVLDCLGTLICIFGQSTLGAAFTPQMGELPFALPIISLVNLILILAFLVVFHSVASTYKGGNRRVASMVFILVYFFSGVSTNLLGTMTGPIVAKQGEGALVAYNVVTTLCSYPAMLFGTLANIMFIVAAARFAMTSKEDKTE